MYPTEAADGVPVTVPHVTDRLGVGSFPDVPESYLAANQATCQALRVPVIELQNSDWKPRIGRVTRNGGILCV